MDGVLTTLAVVGLFVLRLGVPVAVVALVGYALHRMDAKWEAEADAYRRQSMPKVEVTLRPVEQPCWVLKNCPEEMYTHCVAFEKSGMPCWLARSKADGMLPNACVTCTLFSLRRPKHERELVAN
ncbi:MAG: hypothetical protein R2856_20040 [Caldilineaceae bacterium]